MQKVHQKADFLEVELPVTIRVKNPLLAGRAEPGLERTAVPAVGLVVDGANVLMFLGQPVRLRKSEAGYQAIRCDGVVAMEAKAGLK